MEISPLTAEECLVTHGYFGRESASNNIPENSEPSISSSQSWRNVSGMSGDMQHWTPDTSDEGREKIMSGDVQRKI